MNATQALWGFGLAVLGAGISVPNPSYAQTLRPDLAGQLPARGLPQILAQPRKSTVQLQPRDTRGDIGPDFRPRTPTIPLDTTSALSSFRLAFSNGDHHVKEIAVLRVNAQARGVLSDNNGDDNFSFRASWWNIPGATFNEQSGNLSQSGGQVAIPAGPSNTTLALTGFSLRNNRDAEIWGVAVKLDPADNQATIRLELNDGFRSDDSIDYTIQYVWIPNALLDGTRIVTGNGSGNDVRLPAGTNGQLPADDRFVLQGFSLYYDNNTSAENLLAMGVHLDQPGRERGRASDVVSWEDNDRNERIRWQATYLALK